MFQLKSNVFNQMSDIVWQKTCIKKLWSSQGKEISIRNVKTTMYNVIFVRNF